MSNKLQDAHPAEILSPQKSSGPPKPRSRRDHYFGDGCSAKRVTHREQRIAHREQRIAHREQRIAHREQRIAHREQRLTHREQRKNLAKTHRA